MSQQGPAGARIVLVALLFFAAVIGYIDRGSMSVAMPVLGIEFGFSPSQKGWLLSAFFMTYALFQIGAGALVDRFGVFWMFAIGFALWSLATMMTGLATGMISLVVMRLFLGVGESVMFPGFAKVISGNFAAEARGFPNSVLEAGTKIGPALGVFVGGLLLSAYGWRPMFYVLGALSLLWIFPWLIWGPRGGNLLIEPAAQTAAPELAPVGPGFKDLLSCRDAWGTFIGASCYTYAYFFLLTWLPSYLVDVRHLSLKEMGVIGSAPYLAAALAALLAGWASDALVKRGYSATLVRKTFVSIGLLLSMTALPAALVHDGQLSLWLIIVAYVAFGIFASNLWTISQTLAGPVAAGRWAGLQNCLGGLTGVLAPIVTGYIIEGTGSYNMAFLFTALLAVLGTLSYLFIVGPIRQIDWASRQIRVGTK
jgi:MFS family permease